MRRVLLLLTVVALMVVMLAMAASSAMAKRNPSPPSPGELLYSGNDGNAAVVGHCAPYYEDVEGVHGVGAYNNNPNKEYSGHCVLAPPQREG